MATCFFVSLAGGSPWGFLPTFGRTVDAPSVFGGKVGLAYWAFFDFNYLKVFIAAFWTDMFYLAECLLHERLVALDAFDQEREIAAFFRAVSWLGVPFSIWQTALFAFDFVFHCHHPFLFTFRLFSF